MGDWSKCSVSTSEGATVVHCRITCDATMRSIIALFIVLTSLYWIIRAKLKIAVE